MTCAMCLVDVPVTLMRGRQAKYCSATCKQAKRRQDDRARKQRQHRARGGVKDFSAGAIESRFQMAKAWQQWTRRMQQEVTL